MLTPKVLLLLYCLTTFFEQRLRGDDGPRHAVTFGNFRTITRYNHSAMYAMSVYQLSQRLAEGDKG